MNAKVTTGAISCPVIFVFSSLQIDNPNKTQLILSVHHAEAEKYEDAAAIWAEKSESANNYTACTVEARQMSGKHVNTSAVSNLFTL